MELEKISLLIVVIPIMAYMLGCLGLVIYMPIRYWIRRAKVARGSQTPHHQQIQEPDPSQPSKQPHN